MPSARAGLSHCLGSGDSGLAAGPGGAGESRLQLKHGENLATGPGIHFLDTISSLPGIVCILSRGTGRALPDRMGPDSSGCTH